MSDSGNGSYDVDREFAAAIEKRLRAEYLRGKRDGLEVAKMIRFWLTRQPDRAWQAEVRGWADAVIAKAESELNGKGN